MALKIGRYDPSVPRQPNALDGWSLIIDGLLFFVGVWMTVDSFIWYLPKFGFASFLSGLETGLGCFAVLFVKINFTYLMKKLFNKSVSLVKNQTAAATHEENEFDYLNHSLRVGLSTGFLSSRGHSRGLEEDQTVDIPFSDCCQNFLILGGTGSGKTTRFLNPILSQLMYASKENKNNETEFFGGLIFDIKSDFKNTVYKISAQAEREIHTIGVNEDQLKINLIGGLRPAVATDFLRSAYALGGGRSSDSVWLDSALELTEKVLTILQYTETAYTLKGLYEFVFNQTIREQLMKEAKEAHAALLEEDVDFKNAVHYYEQIYSNYDEKLIKSVEFTLSPVIAPFQSKELREVFCDTKSDKNYDLKNILNEGHIVLVDMPLMKYAKAGKTIYTLIKLRYFNLMQTRHDESLGLNKSRYCFFMCDEYQEIIASTGSSGLSDGNFWDKSRSSKMIGIISGQSIEAFITAIGDRSKAQTVLSNFVQKICFRTPESSTIKYFSELIGKAEVMKVSQNVGSSTQSGSWHNSNSEGLTYSTVEKNIVDANLFRELGTLEGYEKEGFTTALACLSVDGMAVDDVIILRPLFVD